MHYGFTAPLLLIAAFIVTSYKIIESPIICYINGAPDGMFLILDSIRLEGLKSQINLVQRSMQKCINERTLFLSYSVNIFTFI